MSRYLKSIFKKSRRYNFSLLENNKEFSKGKKRTTAPGQHGAKDLNHLIINYTCMKNKKLDICMV